MTEFRFESSDSDTLGRATAIVEVVADAIRELGEVPSGHLYAHLMSVMSLETYEGIISILIASRRVKRSNHLLTWVS